MMIFFKSNFFDNPAPAFRLLCRHRVTMAVNQNGQETVYYYLRNSQYSVTALTDETGAVVETYLYTAYGKPGIYDGSGTEIHDSAIGNTYMYTGRRWDADTGMYNFRNRYYHPEMGRFVSRDPIGYEDGYNLYAGWFVVRGLAPYGLQKKLECYPVDTPLFPGKWHYTGLHLIQKPKGGSLGLKIIQAESAELRWYRVNKMMLHICPPQCCMDILEDRIERYSITKYFNVHRFA